jgi:hypothetical protein
VEAVQPPDSREGEFKVFVTDSITVGASKVQQLVQTIPMRYPNMEGIASFQILVCAALLLMATVHCMRANFFDNVS